MSSHLILDADTLDAIPGGTLLIDSHGFIFRKDHDGTYHMGWTPDTCGTADILRNAPLTVVHVPQETA